MTRINYNQYAMNDRKSSCLGVVKRLELNEDFENGMGSVSGEDRQAFCSFTQVNDMTDYPKPEIR